MNKKIIHTVFENRVEQNPHNIAIVYKEQNITYEQLNKNANQLAHTLGSGEYIGVFLSNSIDYVKTILGVLKAGSIFVPIDILTPNNKILSIINKTELKTIVTNGDNYENLSNILKSLNLDVQIILIENVGGLNSNPSLKTHEDDGAYVVFTSGSTGEPKAIVGMQKSLSHFIHWETKEFAIDTSFKISQLAGVTFDVSLRDIFATLISGATLYIPQERTNIQYLAKWIADEKLTLIHIVPSLFRLLLKEFEFSRYDLSSLKHILLAGEALYGHDVLAFHKLYPHVELVNLYGPSETTLAKIFNRISLEKITNPNAIIPLGKAISNTAILILKNSKLVNINQIGEIYIKTPFRSKGYLKDEKRNDEVFVQNPLNEQEDILYKTGDMGRYLENGDIEFVGRADNQVKINGIRVELQEIEIAIKSYEKIENCTIISDVTTNKEIIVLCYYIPKEGFEEKYLREYLVEQIPSYMVPNFFIKMEKFPLNFHGKIDKKSLPKPEDLLYLNREFTEPKTEIEKKVAQIFSQILGVEKISVDIPFMQLGGNSLHSIAATAKISHLFHVQINIKDFFEHQSVEALANLIAKSVQKNTTIEAIAPQHDYELSSSQRRLWVLDKLQENFSAYNIAGIIEFDGDVDAKKLQTSIHILVQRHEILRTNFITIDSKPRQKIAPTPREDIFQNLLVEDVKSYVLAQAKKAFDLENDTLLIVKLINKRTLFINIHHIISDGWSIGILMRELSLIYSQKSLEPLSIQYKDYAYWQNRLLENEDFIQKHQKYWHEVLENPTILEFPLDAPRRATQTFAGENLFFSLDKRVSSKIEMLSQNNTLFVTLLSITNILLSKYSNQEDIIVGSPVANREHEELFNQIGFYVNSLVLRTKIDKNLTVAQTLQNIQKQSLEAFNHQQYPFDKLVDELNLERDLSQNPLFNMMVILQNNEPTHMSFDNLKSSAKLVDTKNAKLDITFNYTQMGDAIELMIEYNTDLFKQSTIERLFLNLETLIDSIELDKKIGELEFISSEEQTLLESFNNTKNSSLTNKTIIEVFEEVVSKNQNNIALYCQERTLSYEQLNQRANNLAYLLHNTYGMSKEMIIPIIMERSENMIISLLGVLKAGCAYLPIDTTYPQERIDYMLQDSKAKLLLTDKTNEFKFQGIEYICVEDIAQTHTENLGVYKSPSSLAYVIYTSGTTGNPKGVMIQNGGFVNMALYQIESFNIMPEDRIIQFASFSFDASVYETFITLLSGASYVIVQKEELLNDFVAITQKYKVNTAVLNPTFLANIGELENFKTIITAGEKAIVQDALRYAKKCNYINAYGPTEASICSAFYKVDATKEYRVIPIGKSIANIKNYILNNEMQLLPIGAIGEIYTAGEGLARGYLGKPALTQEKFIEHPLFTRVYKSGDIGKFREDGNIEYLGRIDNQVKIRGYRVELGEIENAILEDKNILQAVVLLRDTLLVAYIVGESKNIQTRLQAKLPDFMVPQYFMELESFVLTPNGKIDTKSLPNPTIKEKAHRQPTTQMEIELCKIYEAVLGVKVGIDESFFLLGGDSIKAIQIASRVMELGYKLDIKELFKYPKIEDIIPFLVKNTKQIEQKEVVGEIRLTPIQKWFLALDTHEKHYFNQDILMVFDTKDTHVESYLEILLAHHDILRACYQDKKIINKKIDETPLWFREYSCKDDNEFKTITTNIASSFDLEKNDLIRFALIELEGKYYLYIVAHHLMIDGVSWRILIEDLTTLMNGLKLPLKTVSLQEYASRLYDYAKEIEDEVAFWKNEDTSFVLPVENKIEKRVFENLKSLEYSFDTTTTKQLLEDINFAYNTTTQDILILALSKALHESFRVSKSVIALESHGREECLGLDLSRTIGWFTSLYPCHLEYKDTSLSSQIKIQKESLRKIPNNGLGYGVLKYMANQNLEFPKEILFNYLGQFDDATLKFSTKERASLCSPTFISEFKLDISLVIYNKQLQISVKYESHEYSQIRIEMFLNHYKQALREIIEHCLSVHERVLTPDDIDDEDFDINSLDDFLSDLDLSEV